MLIKGKLTVSQASWKLVYNSLLSFLNEERAIAFEAALKIFNTASNEGVDFSFEDQPIISHLSSYQKELAKSYLYKKDNGKLYKPNKIKPLTNRLNSIDIGDYFIEIDKVLSTISFTSINFDTNLDTLIKESIFFNQFLTMVESIDWPTRTGPVKATRGCSIVYITDDNEIVQFYSAGSNPPQITHNLNIASKEPSFLNTTPLKKVSFIEPPIAKEIHKQKIDYVDPELF